MARFTRTKPDQSTLTDLRGSINIRVSLLDSNGVVKGNLNKSVTIKDATVSEVFAALEQFLFEEEGKK